jgi:hypothetical protein
MPTDIFNPSAMEHQKMANEWLLRLILTSWLILVLGVAIMGNI